jgi:hypothetical protein
MSKAEFLKLMREALAKLDDERDDGDAEEFTDWEVLLGEAAMDLGMEQGLISPDDEDDENEDEE